jgi:phasin family protein
MFATPSQFTDIQKGQIDALYALSNVALDATGKLVDLNLAAVKAAMDESAAAAQSLLGVKDAQEMAAVGGTLAQPPVHKFVGYGSNLFSIMSAASAELRRVVEGQIADGNGRVAGLIEFATRNAPAGSEPMVSLFKNALAAYSTAYDTFSKAARQAFEVAEANLNAAARSAVETAATEPAAVRAKPKKGE